MLDSIDFTTLVSNFGRSNEVPLTMTVIPELGCLLVVLPWMMLCAGGDKRAMKEKPTELFAPWAS